MKVKPKCLSCNRIYLLGQDGICELCRSGDARSRRARPPRCLCGKAAVVVILAEVLSPEEEFIELEIPLCRACQVLELAMERQSSRPAIHQEPNPVRVIVVKSLPRPEPRLRGKVL